VLFANATPPLFKATVLTKTVVPGGLVVALPGITVVPPGITVVPPGITVVPPATTVVPPGIVVVERFVMVLVDPLTTVVLKLELTLVRSGSVPVDGGITVVVVWGCEIETERTEEQILSTPIMLPKNGSFPMNVGVQPLILTRTFQQLTGGWLEEQTDGSVCPSEGQSKQALT
jgi:hypothetical protein